MIACFLLEDLRRSRYTLRRYSSGSKCPLPMGYHDAESGLIAEAADDPGKDYHGTNPPAAALDDPRWPARCACGYAFTDADARQVFARGLYRRADTGAVVTWEDAPAGAVRDARWWREGAWMVKLPDGGEFMTEQKATNCSCPDDPAHRCWKVTGAPQTLSAEPSIQTPRWHGFLRNGQLIDA